MLLFESLSITILWLRLRLILELPYFTATEDSVLYWRWCSKFGKCDGRRFRWFWYWTHWNGRRNDRRRWVQWWTLVGWRFWWLGWFYLLWRRWHVVEPIDCLFYKGPKPLVGPSSISACTVSSRCSLDGCRLRWLSTVAQNAQNALLNVF